MSADPAMESYIPEASSNEGARERNQNLPGMGGIYNSRNLQTYHYAGNNPLKYTDPSGREIITIVLAGIIWGMCLGGLAGGMYATTTHKEDPQKYVYYGMASGAGLGAGIPILVAGGPAAYFAAGNALGAGFVGLQSEMDKKSGTMGEKLMAVLQDEDAMMRIGTSISINLGVGSVPAVLREAGKFKNFIRGLISTIGITQTMRFLEALESGDTDQINEILEENPELQSQLEEYVTSLDNSSESSYIHNSSYMHNQQEESAEITE